MDSSYAKLGESKPQTFSNNTAIIWVIHAKSDSRNPQGFCGEARDFNGIVELDEADKEAKNILLLLNF
jgi:hypothetical protein